MVNTGYMLPQCGYCNKTPIAGLVGKYCYPCSAKLLADEGAAYKALAGSYEDVKQKLESAQREILDLRRLMGHWSTVELALKAQAETNLQLGDMRSTLEALLEALHEKRLTDDDGGTAGDWIRDVEKVLKGGTQERYRQPKGKDVFGMLPDFPIPCGREWGNSEGMYGKCDRESGHHGPCGTEVR